MPINVGWYNNLWAVLHGSEPNFRLEVRLVCEFHFRPDLALRPPDDAPAGFRPWTPAQQVDWKQRFTELVEGRWSRQHRLYADVSAGGVDVRRLFDGPFPVADVDFRIIDADSLGETIPDAQVHHSIHVWRTDRGGAHGSAVTRVSALKEDDLRQHPVSGGHEQTAALHEVGHLIGLVHSGCWHHRQDRPNDVDVMRQQQCYGQGPTASSVMGSGDLIRAQDYVVFAYIMRQLRPQWLWFAANHRAERRGGRQALMDRRLLSPRGEWGSRVPGVQSHAARHPRHEVRELRGLA